MPSLPIFFSQPKIAGSFPPTHPISIPFSPRSAFPLAHTAANASPICLNGTSAVPYFGGLSSAFLAALSDITMDSASVGPKEDKRVAIDAVVVRSGCAFKVYLRRIVVSRGSIE